MNARLPASASASWMCAAVFHSWQTWIPVERIVGPVFPVCGEANVEWPSCPYARAADARLAARPGAQRHLLLAYPGAGHKVGLLLPYQPDDGGSADSRGQADAWPQLLDLLRAS